MKKIIITTLVLLLCFSNVCSASDLLYRFTHNDHDVLIVGKITQVDNEKIKADVTGTIVSTEYMNQIDKKVQLNPSRVTIDITNLSLDTTFNVDDFILASLDKTLLEYKVANGLYKVDSTDIRTLKIVCDKEEKDAEIKAIEYFVNSNGTVNRFIIDNESIKMTDTEGNTIIEYQKSDDGYADTLELTDVSTEQGVLVKNYDDAMVVTIILTAGIMAVIILIKFRKKVND